MAKLTVTQQRWIVVQLALFESPAKVVEGFAAEFKGHSITRQKAWEYDCSKAINREQRAKDLVDLFDATRAEFIERTKDVPIANKTWRLTRYQELFEQAVEQGNRKTALGILRQAAEDDGDAYSNRRELTGKDGAPLPAAPPPVVIDLGGLSDAQLDALESLHGRHPESRQHPAREG